MSGVALNDLPKLVSSMVTLREPLPAGRYPITAKDYAMLGDTGAFGDAATELVGGESSS